MNLRGAGRSRERGGLDGRRKKWLKNSLHHVGTALMSYT